MHTTPGEVKRTWQHFTEPWESVRIEVDELIEAGDQVVSRQMVTFRGRAGIEVNARFTYLRTFRDGAIAHLVSYPELGHPRSRRA